MQLSPIETVAEALARGVQITKLPYIPPDRYDPSFSLFWTNVKENYPERDVMGGSEERFP